MLGDAVAKVIPKADICPYYYPSKSFKDYVAKYEVILNCAGVIPQSGKEDFSINTYLPVYLDKYTNAKIIHAASDCENDNSEYGLSKKIATDWILSYGRNTKIIRCSILGIDEHNKSLLSWVLAQKSDIPGYTRAIWSGISTLTWAQIAQGMIKNWDDYEILENYHTEPISKYKLIKLICSIFSKENNVVPVEIGKNKTLVGTYCGKIEDQIKELKEIYGL